MKRRSLRAVGIGFGVLFVVAGCSSSPRDGDSSGAAPRADQTTTVVPVKVPTPPGQSGVVPSGVGLGSPVPIGQRTRVGEFDILVTAPAIDGDGKVIDRAKGPDSYAAQGKKFLLVPVEVSRHRGQAETLPTNSQLVLTYSGTTQTKAEDFATNCPYDEDWPQKVDLWKAPVAVGETLVGNACFIVSVHRAGQFVLGYAPFGTRQGSEVFFRTS